MRKPVKTLLAAALCIMILSVSGYAYASTAALKFGSRGEGVNLLQGLLNQRGYMDHQPTGYFGPLTMQAVITFQLDNSLTVDGIAGPETLGALAQTKENPQPQDNPKAAEEPAEVPETGEYLDWFEEAQYIFKEGDVALITDVDTRLSFKVMRTFGHEHADVETLTEKDSQAIKSIWGGWSWERRAVIVSVNGKHIAASITAMPHAGRDDAVVLKTVSSRSGGYGKGTNLDRIKGNGMDGVICLHFKNSKLHKSENKEPQHQAMVKKAAGL